MTLRRARNPGVYRSKLAQERSKERAEQILDAAAAELVNLGTAEKLTTTELASRAAIPVATLYRYFADRWAVFAALIDRQTAALDREIVQELRTLERVTLEGLFTLFMEVHFRHFSAHPSAVAVWFGARGSDIVRQRVRTRCTHIARWIQEGSEAAGLAERYPEWGGEALVWTADRALEIIFRVPRPEAERQAIFLESVEMMGGQLGKYATAAGRKGIPGNEFLRHAGPFAPPGPSRRISRRF